MKFPKSTTASRRQDRIASTRWLHQSCVAFMQPNPLGAGLPMVPVIRLTGGTYNVGRNKAKREAREAK